jgi:hypothetical protein
MFDHPVTTAISSSSLVTTTWARIVLITREMNDEGDYQETSMSHEMTTGKTIADVGQHQPVAANLDGWMVLGGLLGGIGALGITWVVKRGFRLLLVVSLNCEYSAVNLVFIFGWRLQWWDAVLLFPSKVF